MGRWTGAPPLPGTRRRLPARCCARWGSRRQPPPALPRVRRRGWQRPPQARPRSRRLGQARWQASWTPQRRPPLASPMIRSLRHPPRWWASPGRRQGPRLHHAPACPTSRYHSHRAHWPACWRRRGRHRRPASHRGRPARCPGCCGRQRQHPRSPPMIHLRWSARWPPCRRQQQRLPPRRPTHRQQTPTHGWQHPSLGSAPSRLGHARPWCTLALQTCLDALGRPFAPA
mmetsp:Transcript_87631/g.271335  ORF Transcript_87631/g.271335 Transcript_87631/m.271335 type:complete len:229 (+) Transcript_87631:2375-3061(+)